jgi:hypothetical protein
MSPSSTPPWAFRYIQDAPVAEEPLRRNGGQISSLLDQMERSIHVGARMQDGGDLPGEYTVLGVFDRPMHLHIGLSGIGRSPKAPGMAQFDELQPGNGVGDNIRHDQISLQGSVYRAAPSLLREALCFNSNRIVFPPC